MHISQFQAEDVKRCEAVFHPLEKWSPAEWGCALAGEVGELCNMLKKIRQGDQVTNTELTEELGDVMAYLCLLAARLGFDLENCTINKFNEVSRRKGYVRLIGVPRADCFTETPTPMYKVETVSPCMDDNRKG